MISNQHRPKQRIPRPLRGSVHIRGTTALAGLPIRLRLALAYVHKCIKHFKHNPCTKSTTCSSADRRSLMTSGLWALMKSCTGMERLGAKSAPQTMSAWPASAATLLSMCGRLGTMSKKGRRFPAAKPSTGTAAPGPMSQARTSHGSPGSLVPEGTMFWRQGKGGSSVGMATLGRNRTARSLLFLFLLRATHQQPIRQTPGR